MDVNFLAARESNVDNLSKLSLVPFGERRYCRTNGAVAVAVYLVRPDHAFSTIAQSLMPLLLGCSDARYPRTFVRDKCCPDAPYPHWFIFVRESIRNIGRTSSHSRCVPAGGILITRALLSIPLIIILQNTCCGLLKYNV